MKWILEFFSKFGRKKMTFPIVYTILYRTCGRKYSEGYHLGIDYGNEAGTPVQAILDGTVVLSAELNGFGSLNPSTKGGCIIIKHQDKNGNPFLAIYGHLKRAVEVGSSVTNGQEIGKLTPFTNSGAPCAHLHFGINHDINMPFTKLGYQADPDWTKWEKDPEGFMKNFC